MTLNIPTYYEPFISLLKKNYFENFLKNLFRFLKKNILYRESVAWVYNKDRDSTVYRK